MRTPTAGRALAAVPTIAAPRPSAVKGQRNWNRVGQVAALSVGLAAPIIYGTSQPSPPAEPVPLAACRTAEHVHVLVDESPSVRKVDEEDTRRLAINEIQERLLDTPCADQLMTVSAFTGLVETTGPAHPNSLAPYGSPGGGRTDISAALARAVETAAELPDHRQVLVLISDLTDGHIDSVHVRLDRLTNIDIYVVDIRKENAIGSAQDAVDTANDIAIAINESREATQ